MKQDKYICIAAIAGAFGVKGEIKLKTFTDKPEKHNVLRPPIIH